jgi:heterodisulfide reductase subunit B
MSRNETMKYALLRCCTTAIYLEQYESSTDAVLKKLGVEFVDIKEFNCCGYPLKKPGPG